MIKGSNLNLYFPIDNVLTPVCHAQNCVLTINGDLIETTTKDGSRAKRYEYGGYGWTLKLSGLSVISDEANFFVLQQALLGAVKMPFVFGSLNNDAVYYSGTVLVNNATLDTAFNALSSYSNDLVGDGEFTTIQAGTAVSTDYNGIWDNDNANDLTIYQD